MFDTTAHERYISRLLISDVDVSRYNGANSNTYDLGIGKIFN